MELFFSGATLFLIVSGAIFILVAWLGMWSSGVFDSDISKLKRKHKREEKIARENERHIQAMVAARK